ncbi:hypothetical protein B0T10DRAFT_589603 [Thelonectria olida]|uniref:DUF6603 domain-containing protein n=1 Tax=Thelonectria olida TaxID=1576542 RepID=A0A9P8WAE7_9HYPO|nr:hypothetical protein B0T10DRAFT_589603 [Thelonectria olida]
MAYLRTLNDSAQGPLLLTCFPYWLLPEKIWSNRFMSNEYLGGTSNPPVAPDRKDKIKGFIAVMKDNRVKRSLYAELVDYYNAQQSTTASDAYKWLRQTLLAKNDDLFRDLQRLQNNQQTKSDLQWIVVTSVEDVHFDGFVAAKNPFGPGWDYEHVPLLKRLLRKSGRQRTPVDHFWKHVLTLNDYLRRNRTKKKNKKKGLPIFDLTQGFSALRLSSTDRAHGTEAPVATNDNGVDYTYSFWASIKDPQGATGPAAHRLSNTDPLDAILCDTLSREIGLKDMPTETMSVIPLDERDDFTEWLTLSFGATQPCVKATTTQIESLQFRVSKDATVLVFDTAEAQDSLKSDTPAYFIGLDGVLSGEHGGVVVFGLSPMSQISDTCTLRQICELFGELPKVHSAAIGLIDSFWVLDTKDLIGERNGVWFAPYMNYNTTVRLSFRPKPSTGHGLTDLIHGFFPNAGGITTSNERLVYRSVTHTPADSGKEITLMTTSVFTLLATVTLDVKDWEGKEISVVLRVSCRFDGNNILTLKAKSSREENDFPAFVGAMVSHISNSHVDILESLPDPFSEAMEMVHFRGFTLTIGKDGILGAQVDMEISTKLGRARDSQDPENVALKLSAAYEAGGNGNGLSISSGLWFPIPIEIENPFPYFSDWEDVGELVPITKNAADSLWLPGLLPEPIKLKDLPKNIPQEITEAEFFLSSEQLLVSGTIESCSKYQPCEGLPYLDFSEISIEACFNWKTNQRTVDLEFRLGLVGPPEVDASREICTNQLHQELKLGMLYPNFDSDTKTLLYDILKEIDIRDMTIAYSNVPSDDDPQKTENKFLATGDFVISQHLSIQLTYTKTTTAWKFFAKITKNIKDPVLLVDLAKSVFGSQSAVVTELPDFLANAEILGPHSNSPYVKFEVLKNGDSGVQLLLSAKIGAITASFIQLHSKGTGTEKPQPIRFFCVTCGLPTLPPNPPLFSDFKAPFDQLGFLWTNKTLDATALEAIAKSQADGASGAKNGSSPDEKKPEMKAGFHFTVLSGGVTVLDYPIGKTKAKKPSKKDTNAIAASSDSKQDPVPDDAVDEQSPKAPLKKSQGPLSINDIRLVYKEKTLAVKMNAVFAMGPLLFALLGFEISLEFGGKVSLSNIDFRNVSIGLDGLATSFKKPPLMIEGALMRKKDDGGELYAGGITIGFVPWLFQAAGFYGKRNKPGTNSTFTSALVYAMLRGPLITLEFATISGITGGFGYNVGITIPQAADIYRFPLVSPPAQTDIMQVLDALMAEGSPRWFYPEEGAMWLAAGLTVTAFEMLDITAVLVAQWSPQIQFHVLGLAVADIPNAKSPFKLAHVELGFHASVDLAAGLFSVEAQLSPNSYILDPNCHLSGGFALYYWFKTTDVGREGDWVFTIGGYHSAFQIPPNYPRPPRLAISWALGSALAIKGEAYFAITPKACMGGLHLNAVLTLGPLRAWFDAYVDFLINYAPFNFMAVGHVSIGVSYNMDVWFIHIHISVEIGATLRLTGPPVAGIVHVEFWVFGFDIEFGDHSSQIDNTSLTIDKFFEMAMGASAPGGNKTGPPTPHVYACLSGLISEGTEAESKPNAPWKTRGGLLLFDINAQFALNTAKVNDVDVPAPEDNWKDEVFAKPMREPSPLKFHLMVTIKGPGNSKDAWRLSPVMKSVPGALWGKYDERTDPTAGGNNSISELLSGDGGCVRLMMGVEIKAPEPNFAHEEKLLPFDTEAADLQPPSRAALVAALPKAPGPGQGLDTGPAVASTQEAGREATSTRRGAVERGSGAVGCRERGMGQWGAVNEAWGSGVP